MSEEIDQASAVQPVPCQFCGSTPTARPILVHYGTPRRNGAYTMFRAACECGAIGKCRPSPAAAVESWNEPWQALVHKDVCHRLVAQPAVVHVVREAYREGWCAGFCEGDCEADWLKSDALAAMQVQPVAVDLSEPKCAWCGATPIREVLDNEPLCQNCCNLWARGEGDYAAMQDEKSGGAAQPESAL